MVQCQQHNKRRLVHSSATITKRDICELARQTHGRSQAQIAKLVQEVMGLRISCSTLIKVLRNEIKLLSLAPQQGTRKRQHAGEHEHLVMHEVQAKDTWLVIFESYLLKCCWLQVIRTGACTQTSFFPAA